MCGAGCCPGDRVITLTARGLPYIIIVLIRTLYRLADGMHYTIELLEKDGILRITVNGSFGQESLNEISGAMVKAIQEHGCNRVLLDHRAARSELTTEQLFRRPHAVRAMGLDPGCRIALIFGGQEEDYRFLEHVTRNRGIQAKVFRTPEEGLVWLKGEEA